MVVERRTGEREETDCESQQSACIGMLDAPHGRHDAPEVLHELVLHRDVPHVLRQGQRLLHI